MDVDHQLIRDVEVTTASLHGGEIDLSKRDEVVYRDRGYTGKKYRRRKLGERYFENLESRRSRCYYRKPENRHKGMILLGCEHNIIEFFKNQDWCDQFTKLKT